MPLRALICDLDQTLVNSSPLEVLRSQNLWDQVLNRLDEIQVYEGIAEILQFCNSASVRVGVVTSSPRPVCDAILARFGLRADAVVAANEARFPKPSAHPVFRALNLMHIQASDAAVIGDRCVDIASGKSANVAWTIGAGWGTQDSRSLILANPTFLALTVEDAQRLIFGIVHSVEYREWLSLKQLEARTEFENQMWDKASHSNAICKALLRLVCFVERLTCLPS